MCLWSELGYREHQSILSFLAWKKDVLFYFNLLLLFFFNILRRVILINVSGKTPSEYSEIQGDFIIPRQKTKGLSDAHYLCQLSVVPRHPSETDNTWVQLPSCCTIRAPSTSLLPCHPFSPPHCTKATNSIHFSLSTPRQPQHYCHCVMAATLSTSLCTLHPHYPPHCIHPNQNTHFRYPHQAHQIFTPTLQCSHHSHQPQTTHLTVPTPPMLPDSRTHISTWSDPLGSVSSNSKQNIVVVFHFRTLPECRPPRVDASPGLTPPGEFWGRGPDLTWKERRVFNMWMFIWGCVIYSHVLICSFRLSIYSLFIYLFFFYYYLIRR